MKKKFTALLLTAFIGLLLAACSSETPEPAQKPADPKSSAAAPGPGPGESFTLGGETYTLLSQVPLPKYDSATATGIGIIFAKKEDTSPIIISGGQAASLIDMTLDMAGGPLESSNITFNKSDSIPGYALSVRFEFLLPKGAALPASGKIYHTGKKDEKAVSLAGLKTAVLAEPAPAEPAAAEPADLNPALPEAAKPLLGEWELVSIKFFTPVPDNGIFGINATLGIQEGYQHGRDLTLNGDLTMQSNVSLNPIPEASTMLPFEITDLDLRACSSWEYDSGTILISDGPALKASYDEASKILSLTQDSMKMIASRPMPGLNTKSSPVSEEGSVELEITLGFKAKQK
ncbi:MAG: hypothetical protein LBK52_02500 [Deltaproteobacteria bacterium]|jgi:hypothetical protein|nr:hypothetical protein [Deltaproteobacteria bacterium]